MGAIKFFFVFLVILFYFCSTLAFYPLTKWRPYWTKKKLNGICQGFSKLLLWILNVKVNEVGTNPKGNFFIVSNHLGYLDVLVISSLAGCSFVTSEDIRKTPFLGQICSLAGCLFVNRKNRANIKNETRDIRNGLQSGMSVAVFPEATSTNGEEVLKFKRSLFQASIDADVPVLPLTINYGSIDKRKVETSNRDYVCWYGDMSFLPHLWNLCGRKEVSCEILYHPALLPAGMTCGDLRDLSLSLVREGFKPLSGGENLFLEQCFGTAAFEA